MSAGTTGLPDLWTIVMTLLALLLPLLLAWWWVVRGARASPPEARSRQAERQ
ncbi:MAG: hypothetical protein ACM32J_07185 [Rhizobacter sp.]